MKGKLVARELSAKQSCIIRFIRAFLSEQGYPPSIRDIARGCRISSTSVVVYNLNKLEERGYIRRHGDVSRGIALSSDRRDKSRTVSVPIRGEIAAGAPIPVPDAENSAVFIGERTDVSADMLRGREGIYALRVKGDSMMDALIKDGDIVLMQYTKVVEAGEMVAVWLKKEGEVTLKRFFPEEKTVRLEPANRQMQPIYTAADNVEIQGRVIGVIRYAP